MDNLRLGCAVCRILIRRLVNRIRGEEPKPPKPVVHAIAIGLTGAGKSSILACLAGEPTEDIKSTTGFHIKDITLPNCIVTVKELGGSETVRKYWHHYYSNQQAVIFMVNGCRSQEDTLLDKEVFLSAINHPSLSDLPVLLLVTHQDVQGCRSPDSIIEDWCLDEEFLQRIRVGGAACCQSAELKDTLESFCDEIINIISPSQIKMEQTDK